MLLFIVQEATDWTGRVRGRRRRARRQDLPDAGRVIGEPALPLSSLGHPSSGR